MTGHEAVFDIGANIDKKVQKVKSFPDAMLLNTPLRPGS
jgi:hypothetical protein